MLSICFGSFVAAFQVMSANAGRIDVSGWFFLPSFLALLMGAGFYTLVVGLGGSDRAAGISGTIGAILLTTAGSTALGGELLAPLIVPVVMAAVYLLVARIERGLSLHYFLVWLTIALGFSNASFVAAALLAAPEVDRVQPPVAEIQATTETHPDVIILILDEFGSIELRPLPSGVHEGLLAMADLGYRIDETLWATYTVSAAAVASILDAGYPHAPGEPLDEVAHSRLGVITQGSNRLSGALIPLGYRFTMVEGGLWMTECGTWVDRCVASHWLDEAVGTAIERSLFRGAYERLWGDSFTVSGLHAMEKTSAVFDVIAGNGSRDLVVSHVMLPHFPYVLDADCELVPWGQRDGSVVSPGLRTGAYVDQASCVLRWLSAELLQLDRNSRVPPAVVVVGDHGTAFNGQLRRPLRTWTAEDRVERLASFGMIRLPERCPQNDFDVTAQMVDGVIACLAGLERRVEPRHILSTYAGDPSVIEIDNEEVERAWSHLTEGSDDGQ